MMTLDWRSFDELDIDLLYEIMKLRQRVFIVEQNSPYLDCDGIDQSCHHLLIWEETSLAAYLRVVPPGVKYPEGSIGRVVSAPEFRGKGFGQAVVKEGLKKLSSLYGEKAPVKISAQAYLQKFYEDFGFRRISQEPYLEDGIPHVEMKKN